MDPLQQLRTLTKQLITEHNIDHETIKKEVYSAVKELSDELPPIKVLYNKTYGGFGYSTQFQTYLDMNGVDSSDFRTNTETRVQNVTFIERYGKQCKEAYPFVSRLIALYNKYNLRHIFCQVSLLSTALDRLKDIDDATNKINARDEKEFGSDTDMQYGVSLYGDVDNLIERYEKTSLLSTLSDMKSKTLVNVSELKSNIADLLQDKTHIDLILENNRVHFPEEDDDAKVPWYAKKKWEDENHDRMCFLDAVTKYGEDYFGIWKCQGQYTESIMRFLLKFHSQFQIQSPHDYCTDLEVGLLCASGKYCQLSVGDAPQLLHWWIGEYDGLESIVVQP